jgi:hypothetical protein
LIREPHEGALTMIVKHRLFKSTLKSWDTLCEEAAAFASTIPRDKLITIAHSEDHNTGVVIVWYWS